ncbi:MAG: hypothetical protein PHY16_18305 [Methylobacter sp.]|nr:hypothetical protein [Methylobacter sp.]
MHKCLTTGNGEQNREAVRQENRLKIDEQSAPLAELENNAPLYQCVYIGLFRLVWINSAWFEHPA